MIIFFNFQTEVRLKYRISYVPSGDAEVVEIGEASKIPIN